MASLTRSGTSSPDSRRALLRFDWPLLIAACMLLTFGLMSLFSIDSATHGPHLRTQAIFVLVGIVPFMIFATVQPKTWMKAANVLYVVDVVLLIAVLFVGKHVKGADRWIKLPGGTGFQPSELAKLLTTITLSSFYANRSEAIERVSTFILSLAHVAVPVVLVLLQPHLGAAMVIMVMWFAVSLLAGAPLKHLGLACVGFLVLAGTMFSVPSIRNKFLHGYQADRIEGLQSKKKDVKGANWQTYRAEIAFGVGGVGGTGFMRGEQKEGGFIPEQYNDFIVTVIGEEGGLVGCTLLLATYGFFFYRIFLVMLHATEPYYRMIAGGLFAVLGFHTFVNIAMVLQIVPVVGLWLPFLSHGGTAVWLCMGCVGLLIAIRKRERPLLF